MAYAQVAGDELPSDWEVCEDEESKEVFYYNSKTDETQWDRPEPRARSPSPVREPEVAPAKGSVMSKLAEAKEKTEAKAKERTAASAAAKRTSLEDRLRQEEQDRQKYVSPAPAPSPRASTTGRTSRTALQPVEKQRSPSLAQPRALSTRRASSSDSSDSDSPVERTAGSKTRHSCVDISTDSSDSSSDSGGGDDDEYDVAAARRQGSRGHKEAAQGWWAQRSSTRAKRKKEKVAKEQKAKAKKIAKPQVKPKDTRSPKGHKKTAMPTLAREMQWTLRWARWAGVSFGRDSDCPPSPAAGRVMQFVAVGALAFLSVVLLLHATVLDPPYMQISAGSDMPLLRSVQVLESGTRVSYLISERWSAEQLATDTDGQDTAGQGAPETGSGGTYIELHQDLMLALQVRDPCRFTSVGDLEILRGLLQFPRAVLSPGRNISTARLRFEMVGDEMLGALEMLRSRELTLV